MADYVVVRMAVGDCAEEAKVAAAVVADLVAPTEFLGLADLHNTSAQLMDLLLRPILVAMVVVVDHGAALDVVAVDV